MPKNQRRTRTKKGGSAWQYTQSVYGAPNEQHAVPVVGNSSNVIAMNQVGGSLEPLQPANFNESAGLSTQGYAVVDAGSANAATNVLTNYNMTGGARARRGGTVLGELVVPATLLIANEAYKRRSKKSFGLNTKGKKKVLALSRKRRGSRRR